MMASSLKYQFFASIAVALAFYLFLIQVLSSSRRFCYSGSFLPEELGWLPLREVLGVILSLTSDIAHWIHLS